MKNIFILVTIIANIIFSQEINAQSLSIKEYLSQIEKNNPAFKAAKEGSEGAKLRNGESDLLVLPIITLQASQTKEEKDTLTPNISGTDSKYENYKIALEQYTPIGLHVELKYEQNYRNTQGASANFLPEPKYYTSSPTIELSQSLWRNGFGREIRAKRALIDHSSLATHYSEKFKSDGILIESQLAYMKLYYARQTLVAIKESLEVSSKIRDWSKRRTDQELADRSDYLQAKAAHEFREFELIQATQDEKSAARQFNSLRGFDSDVVAEILELNSNPAVKKDIYSPKKSRNDVRSAEQMLEAARASSLEGAERGRPTLDIFANYGHYAVDTDESKSQSDSFKDDFPFYTVGVRFQSPLMFGILSDMKDGYQKEVVSAQLNLQRKMQEQERDYNDLISKIETAQSKLKLANTLEQSQKEKAEAERVRQRKGRSTLFQALQFEQDYVDSRLNKIKTESELNALLTQLQLYKEEI